jgi:hypothetical protein
MKNGTRQRLFRYEKKGEARAEGKYGEIYVQHAEHGHQNHQKQAFLPIPENKHAYIQRDRSAEQPR